jgi:hypothetical protein
MVIWHEVLFKVNTVRNKLQSPSMSLASTMLQMEGIDTFFHNYKNEHSASSLNIAQETVSELGVEPWFLVKCQCSRRRKFDEAECEEAILQAEEDFKVNYFLVMLDMSIISLMRRFEEFKPFKSIFRFLMSSRDLKSLNGSQLRDRCNEFAETFSRCRSSD